MPAAAHAGWKPASDRLDPVSLLEGRAPGARPRAHPPRPDVVSPFTFYRGAAKIMATDLRDTPTAGLNVQLCGDAHLSNFGGYASPERTLLFDLNDFDETLPGPFEYDLKRMAASFTIAAPRTMGSTNPMLEQRHARRRPIEHRWPSSPRCAPWTSGTHACLNEELMSGVKDTSGWIGRAVRRSGRLRRSPAEKQARRRTLSRQLAGALEARRAGRWALPDRQ